MQGTTLTGCPAEWWSRMNADPHIRRRRTDKTDRSRNMESNPRWIVSLLIGPWKQTKKCHCRNSGRSGRGWNGVYAGAGTRPIKTASQLSFRGPSGRPGGTDLGCWFEKPLLYSVINGQTLVAFFLQSQESGYSILLDKYISRLRMRCWHFATNILHIVIVIANPVCSFEVNILTSPKTGKRWLIFCVYCILTASAPENVQKFETNTASEAVWPTTQAATAHTDRPHTKYKAPTNITGNKTKILDCTPAKNITSVSSSDFNRRRLTVPSASISPASLSLSVLLSAKDTCTPAFCKYTANRIQTTSYVSQVLAL